MYVNQLVKGLWGDCKVFHKVPLHFLIFLSSPLILNSIAVKNILSIFLLMPQLPYIK